MRWSPNPITNKNNMKRTFSPAPISQAFDWTERWQPAFAPQELPLSQAAGHCLTQALTAEADIPLRASSARDGHALRSADTLGAGDYNPLPLRLVSVAQGVAPGSAVRVSTGDELPAGADAVLNLEQADVRGDFLDVAASLAPGDGVIQIGEECRQGDVLLPAGRRLRPQDLARLALAGYERVEVSAKPRVQICLAGRFSRDGDGPMLAAMIERDGAKLERLERSPTAENLVQTLSGFDADLMLVVGATGYGERDHAVAALQECGRVDIDGVTLHPGGGLVLGEVAGRPVILLPGSPLACLCAYDLVAARLLRRLAGKPGALPYRRQRLSLSRKLVSRIGQMEVARMRIDGETTEPLAVVDDRLLSNSIRADGFVLLPENSEGFAEGALVEVYRYDETD
ncbi:MAG: molybdopterin molybdotransferase MoeA [Candidatus Thiodiazotropha sp.]